MSEGSGTALFKCWKIKELSMHNSAYPANICFRNERNIKTLSDEEKLREFVYSRPDLKE